MTDQQTQPGDWLAVDGRWYPAHMHPDYVAPIPAPVASDGVKWAQDPNGGWHAVAVPLPPRFSRASLVVTAFILIGLAVAGGVYEAWASSAGGGFIELAILGAGLCALGALGCLIAAAVTRPARRS